jgi:hypothetical protein
MQNWHRAVVDRLIWHRSSGLAFREAWSRTMFEFPPRDRLLGEVTPRLFDERCEAPESQLAFFKRACESAYHHEVGKNGSGVGPALRSFRPEMLRDLDLSGPAMRARPRMKNAA